MRQHEGQSIQQGLCIQKHIDWKEYRAFRKPQNSSQCWLYNVRKCQVIRKVSQGQMAEDTESPIKVNIYAENNEGPLKERTMIKFTQTKERMHGVEIKEENTVVKAMQ